MAKAKKEQGGLVRGRALVDIPGVARCGEFVSLPAQEAQALEAGGQFDPRAVENIPS